MPPKNKVTKPKLPDIPWAEDDHTLVWKFIAEMEKDENYKVLFGKKDSSENTSGDSRTTVFKWIAAILFPDLFSLDGSAIADQLKGQLERLTKTYRKHAARLRQTGEGVNKEVGVAGDEQLEYYISGEGPDDSTPPGAVNLWQQIENEFKFFPRLHRIFASRPNVTPIVITTALGPHGRKTLWIQRPEDDTENVVSPPAGVENLDYATQEIHHPAPPTPSQLGRTFGTDITTTPNVSKQLEQPPGPPSTNKRSAKPSSISRNAIDKARLNVEKHPQKRTLVDTMLEIQEKNNAMWDADAKERALKAKKDLLLEELKLGVWTVEAYLQKKDELENGAHPAKRQKVKARSPSPDWNLNDFDVGSD